MAVTTVGAIDYAGGSVVTAGQYLNVNITGVNLRASHTIGVRLKNTGTATNFNSSALLYTSQSDTTGSGICRLSGASSTSLNFLRQGNFFALYARDQDQRSTCYGNTSTWYHLCLVYDASSQLIKTYIDGVKIGTDRSSTTTRTSSSTANGFTLGAHPGKYADAFYFNRALSDSEVAQMSDYREPQVTSGLIIFWRLDSNANDSSGNGNNGSTGGSGTAVSYSTSDNPPQPETPTVDIAGTASSASTITGTVSSGKPLAVTATSASTATGALIQTHANAGTATSASTLGPSLLTTLKPVAATLSSASTLTTAALVQAQALAGSPSSASTLSAWARPRWGRRIAASAATDLTRAGASVSASAWTLMTWFRTLDSSSEFRVGWIANAVTVGSNAGNLRIRLFDNNTSTFSIDYSAADDLQWHHLALSFDGTTARAYVDGAQVASAASTVSGTFGAVSWDALSSGAGVAEVAQTKIWSRKLEESDINSERLYNTPHHWPSALFGWWQLAWSNVTLDGSGNGNTLTDNGSLEAQSEAPSTETAPLNALAGTPSSASTLTGAIAQLQPLGAAMGSDSTLSALLGQQQPIAGSASSASTLAALLGQQQPIAGTPSSASTLTAALVQAQALTGTLLSASTLTGEVVQSYAVSGSLASASTLTGELNTLKPLASDVFDASTLTGAMTQLQALAGSSTSASTLVPAALGIDGLYAGTATSASILDGALSTEKPVASTAQSASTLTASISNNQPLAGTLASASSFTGSTSLPTVLEGELASSSALAGVLLAFVDGTTQSASTLTGAIGQFQPLDGEMEFSASTLSAALTMQPSASALTSASTLTASMLRLGPVDVAGTAASSSTLSGTLTGGGGGGGGGGGISRALRRMSAIVAGRRPVR